MQNIKYAIKTLKLSQEKIGTPDKWCKGGFAKDISGHKVEIRSRAACQFCSVGALLYHTKSGDPSDAFAYLANVIGLYVSPENDDPSTTHLHVMMAYDFAILMAQDDLEAAEKGL